MRTVTTSRRPPTGINPAPAPGDPPPASAGTDGGAGVDPTGEAAAGAPCGGSTDPYDVNPPAGMPAGGGVGAEVAAGGVVGIGAAAGAADVGAVSIDAANDVIGAGDTGGTPPAAAAPAAKPRPKSIPNDGIGEPCNPGAPNPVGGDIPPGRPPKPPISPCNGPIGSPPPEPPPGIPGRLGNPPPINDVNGLWRGEGEIPGPFGVVGP
ncbi:hypothetical protein H7I93_13195, partial [Mycobacterium nebraskense]|nr:hypothetical protein [Mycobacterium nebraskense]